MPPDLVVRDFRTRQFNQLWVADLTYVDCWTGLVYVSFVIDALSRVIAGYLTSPAQIWAILSTSPPTRQDTVFHTSWFNPSTRSSS